MDCCSNHHVLPINWQMSEYEPVLRETLLKYINDVICILSEQITLPGREIICYQQYVEFHEQHIVFNHLC